VQSFEAFAIEHSARLMRLAYLLTGQRQDAEDLTHDALIRMRSRWQRIAAAKSPRAYTSRVLLNVYLSGKRSPSWTEVPLRDDTADPTSEGDFSAAADDRDAIRSALLAVPERQRAVLVLRYYEGLDTREIGEIMGIGESSVRSALARGIRMLRYLLEAADAPEEATEETNA
jgi:RNA polymerase sigma-70 factor (sigma-E family)